MTFPRVERLGGGPRAPLVLLHGTDGPTTATFRPLLPALRSTRRPLLLPTRRGWPAPDGSVAAGGPAGFDADADDLEDLLAELGPAHVLGYSYGCLGALAVAARAAGGIRSLVLLEPPLLALAADVPAVGSIIGAQAALAASASLADEEYLEAYRGALGARARSPRRLTPTGHAVVRAMRGQRPAVEFLPNVDGLARFAAPTTIVTGAWSAAFELIADRLAALLPTARRVRLDAGRHELPALGTVLAALLEERLAAAEGVDDGSPDEASAT